MASYINLEKDEFDPLMEETAAIHQKELEEIRELTAKLRELMSASGGFHADYLSQYIHEMLDMVEQTVLPVIEAKFALTEQEISTFTITASNVDTIC